MFDVWLPPKTSRLLRNIGVILFLSLCKEKQLLKSELWTFCPCLKKLICHYFNNSLLCQAIWYSVKTKQMSKHCELLYKGKSSYLFFLVNVLNWLCLAFIVNLLVWEIIHLDDNVPFLWLQCLNGYGNDISKCQFYMDMLAECRRNSGASLSA